MGKVHVHTGKRISLKVFPACLFIFTLILYTGLHASAPDENVSISGIVTDGTNPVENAVVSLVGDSLLIDTTDADGAFLITNMTGTGSKAKRHAIQNNPVLLHGGTLHFSLPDEVKSGKVTLHSANGSCIFRNSLVKNKSGAMTQTLPKLATGLYLVTFSANDISGTRKLVVTGRKMYLCKSGIHTASSSGTLHAVTKQDAVDQLRLTKEGFVPKRVGLASFMIEDLSIEFKADDAVNETSLCERYRNYFHIGAAVDGGSYQGAAGNIWKQHFNSMVCENEMKWASLQPSAGGFQFGTANGMVNTAKSNGMYVRGHTLCWFDQTPSWVFQGSKETVLDRLKNHVRTVVTEFKGRVDAWDVVNEAVVPYDAGNNDLGEDLTNLDHWGYRASEWYTITGEDHIFEAFRTARETDPDVKLFYNDYWNYLDGKRDFIISFVKRLKEEGLIDGIGLQSHMNITAAQVKMNNQSAWQTVENYEREIREYAAMGLDVHITELDISIYTRDYPSTDQSKWYTGNDLNDEYQDKLAARYKEFFDMFRRNADIIQNVTLWGISDDNTWLSEFESGRPDHPLLFNKQLQPKKAFDAIMDF